MVAHAPNPSTLEGRGQRITRHLRTDGSMTGRSWTSGRGTQRQNQQQPSGRRQRGGIRGGCSPDQVREAPVQVHGGGGAAEHRQDALQVEKLQLLTVTAKEQSQTNPDIRRPIIKPDFMENEVTSNASLQMRDAIYLVYRRSAETLCPMNQSKVETLVCVSSNSKQLQEPSKTDDGLSAFCGSMQSYKVHKGRVRKKRSKLDPVFCEQELLFGSSGWK
ncbi:hypothetical protein AAY473_007374 [Plecturocebus cupreus]